jgi:hypothetical protein
MLRLLGHHRFSRRTEHGQTPNFMPHSTGYSDALNCSSAKAVTKGFHKLTKILESFHRLVQDKIQNVFEAGFISKRCVF